MDRIAIGQRHSFCSPAMTPGDNAIAADISHQSVDVDPSPARRTTVRFAPSSIGLSSVRRSLALEMVGK